VSVPKYYSGNNSTGDHKRITKGGKKKADWVEFRVEKGRIKDLRKDT
jgi:hypothetical protein